MNTTNTSSPSSMVSHDWAYTHRRRVFHQTVAVAVVEDKELRLKLTKNWLWRNSLAEPLPIICQLRYLRRLPQAVASSNSLLSSSIGMSAFRRRTFFPAILAY